MTGSDRKRVRLGPTLFPRAANPCRPVLELSRDLGVVLAALGSRPPDPSGGR